MKQQRIEPKFIYEDGKTLCIIVDPDTEEHIKATAAVHPDDLDYESKLVGCTIAYNRAIELLNNGGNLLIYPEGAWNVTPNEMVMKIFTGTVRMAKETGVDIIPIAVEQYDNVFYLRLVFL